MKKLLAAAAASIACILAAPVAADDSNISSEVIEQEDGTRTLVHDAVIDAPASAVWAALSTAEGWKMWGPKFAYFDLRLGGRIETGYHDNARLGDPQNIVHRIIAFVPERMIALQVAQAPKNGPVDIELIKQVWGVYELEPLGDNRTRLRISGVGYGSDEASSQILEFFKSGNVYSIEMLRRNLAAQFAAAAE